jgi:hypothetical protein
VAAAVAHTAVVFASPPDADGNDGRELPRMSADSGGGAAEAAAAAVAHTAVVFAPRASPAVRVGRRGRMSCLR